MVAKLIYSVFVEWEYEYRVVTDFALYRISWSVDEGWTIVGTTLLGVWWRVDPETGRER